MKTLTKAQVFQHMADNMRECKSPVDGLRVGDGSTWAPMSQGYSIAGLMLSESHFALEPRTHTLNGYDVPAPETDAPEYETEYWILNALGDDGVLEYLWASGSDDQNALRNGLWLSKEDAIANAKALRGENPYE